MRIKGKHIHNANCILAFVDCQRNMQLIKCLIFLPRIISITDNLPLFEFKLICFNIIKFFYLCIL